MFGITISLFLFLLSGCRHRSVFVLQGGWMWPKTWLWVAWPYCVLQLSSILSCGPYSCAHTRSIAKAAFDLHSALMTTSWVMSVCPVRFNSCELFFVAKIVKSNELRNRKEEKSKPNITTAIFFACIYFPSSVILNLDLRACHEDLEGAIQYVEFSCIECNTNRSNLLVLLVTM